MILVGDSVANVVLGYEDTLQVTTEDIAHHVAAVARTEPRALVVGDLPWLSYHVSTSETVHNAAKLVRAGAGAAAAGCSAVVLEGGPDAVARLVTDTIAVPTIGIGAGRHCDGQVLVMHDLLGLEDRKPPKFVRRYADLANDAIAAVSRFADDVRNGRFPSSDETYHAADTVSESLNLYTGGESSEDAPSERTPAT
jgi:3-methyl-2-oxobutanoate hydroxymethyltransferase